MVIREGKKWINSGVFRERAIFFKENGYYCSYPQGTPDWLSFWKEELRRCIEGYEVFDDEGNSHKITGHHYAYLNYAVIEKDVNSAVEIDEDDDEVITQKEMSFPDFWDGDYNFFWSLEIARNGICSDLSLVNSTPEEREQWKEYNKSYNKAKRTNDKKTEKEYKEKRDKLSEKILDRLGLYVKPHLDYLNGGYHFIVGKARRKGYSYKNSFILANFYNTIRDKLLLIGAYDKAIVSETFKKTVKYLNFFNEHTAWAKKFLDDEKDFKRSGYIEEINGVKVEKGYKTTLSAKKSFMDNPDAFRGVDAYYILFEESGAWDNLGASFNATYPSLTVGSKMSGQICIIGTSGDLKKGSVDYANMFYNPLAFKIMPFVNIWDEGAENTVCGFFHPACWNMEGFYDAQGNSNIEKALKWEDEQRERILRLGSMDLLQKRLQEFPNKPAEAFIVSSTTFFPVEHAKKILLRLKTTNANNRIKKVDLVYDGNKVITKPSKRDPITSLVSMPEDKRSCVVIYEEPIDNAPKNTYRIGYDPLSQDEGTSLGAIVVYKGFSTMSATKDEIVAEYVGRPDTEDELNEIACKLAIYYGAQIMHENQFISTKNYFRRIKRLDLLSLQPDKVISKTIKDSKTNRVYGCHLPVQLKKEILKNLRDKLLEVVDYDENNNPIYMIDKVRSTRFLEEIINYNDKDNFDYISAMIMVTIQNQELILMGENHVKTVHRIAEQLRELYKR